MSTLDSAISPEAVRSYDLAGSKILAFAKTVNDEDSLIVRNLSARRTVIVPMGRYGDFHHDSMQIGVAALEYACHLFPGRSLTKHEVHNLADIVLNNYDLVFNHRPEKELTLEQQMERAGLIVSVNGEKIIDATS